MAFNYAKAQATAKRLIKNFGGPGVFVLPGNSGTKDPNTGDTVPPTADVEFPGTVTPVLPFSETSVGVFTAMELPGMTIKAGDAYVFFDGEELPAIGAEIITNGVRWRVVGSFPLTSAGGIRVFTQVQLRK